MQLDQIDNPSSKYEGFIPSGCRDIGIRKLEFGANSQFFKDKILILEPKLRTLLTFSVLNIQL